MSIEYELCKDDGSPCYVLDVAQRGADKAFKHVTASFVLLKAFHSSSCWCLESGWKVLLNSLNSRGPDEMRV